VAVSFGTVCLALLANGEPEPEAAIEYAMRLVERDGGRLCATLVVPPLVLPALSHSGYSVATQMLRVIEKENLARKEQAESKAAKIRAEAERRGATAFVEILSAAYDPPSPHLRCRARVSDLCVMAGPSSTDPQQREIVVEMLFGAGVPLLLTPAEWRVRDKTRRAVVAWDGSRVAARAVRDSLPLLAETEVVEIVSIVGEKDIGHEASAADLEQHLSRHCNAVSVCVLPASGDGVAATLMEQVRHFGADLLVMGAYGHSRLREFILGGATRDMLAEIETPTLMSH
jgi:nucleotide-binding universal stress UspA family protein